MIRKPTVAGRFYPGEASELKNSVVSYLRDTKPPKGEIRGILVPHAGYVYSGATAGEGFSAIHGMDIDSVVIIGTAHTMYMDGAALIKEGFFETPLGKVEIDKEITQELLKKSKLFENFPEAHESEHSVEVEIPFLQVSLTKKFKIAPIVLNTKNLEKLYEIGKTIAEVIKDKKALICVSSDLSHYPPGDIAEKSDLTIMEALRLAMRNDDLSYFDLANKITLAKERSDMDTPACGESAIIAGAAACSALGADDFQLLRYTHSGKISGNDASVVGYAAGVFAKTENKSEKAEKLTSDMKSHLLHCARKSMAYYLKNKKEMTMPLSDIPQFNVPAAVFVTLTLNGGLRGCIGTMEPRSSLLDAIVSFSVSAAFRDPRFKGLKEREFQKVKIEISILSPMSKVENYKDVQKGKHGVFIKKGISSGTYLPQVWDHFDSREGFLSSLCAEKAGLPDDAWEEKSTEIYVYTVDSLKEE